VRCASLLQQQLAALALIAGRRDRAIACWRIVVRLQPDRPEPAATLAHLLAGSGRTDEARALLGRVIELNASDAAHWFNLGFLQQQAHDHAVALSSFDRALAIDPKLDRAWYGRAISLLKLERVDEAIAALERNTELQPLSPYGWYQLAHAYQRIGRGDRAQRVVRRLLGFEPQVAERLRRELGEVVTAG
jgi:tetratricopeptide (TPR) repeat protein